MQTQPGLPAILNALATGGSPQGQMASASSPVMGGMTSQALGAQNTSPAEQQYYSPMLQAMLQQIFANLPQTPQVSNPTGNVAASSGVPIPMPAAALGGNFG